MADVLRHEYGHALADTLANTRDLDRDATLDAFNKRLASPSTERLLALARIALEGREGHKTSPPEET